MGFSTQEVSDIKESWEVPKTNLTDSGAAILVHFVTKYPQNLVHFLFKDVPVADLNVSYQLTIFRLFLYIYI